MDLATEIEAIQPRGGEPAFWLRPTSYWQPAHLPLSAWVTHAPFAAWLIDVVRPRSVVELGTHLGFSCFAFAEAAKRLCLDTRIHAVDTWQGDDHAGFYGEDVYDFVRGIAESDYPDSIRMHRGWFSDARPEFDDGSVDLLHIDGRHGYEDVVSDYREWRGAVRDGGVVVFHDIAERENGFGVWRLWQELSADAPSFAFDHGHGLGVLGVGEVAPGPLHDLLTADEATSARIRADFEQLGDVVARLSYLQTQPEQAERAWAEVREFAAHVQALESVIDSCNDRIDGYESSTSWRVTAPLRAIGRLRRS